MTKVVIKIISFILLILTSTSCSLNYSIEDLNDKAPSSEGPNLSKFDKIYVDLTEATIVEGSVAIINVAVNPVRDTDTKVKLTLTSPTSAHIRFNPIPVQITIPAGLTSKSVILNSIDDALVQSQEIWNFNITSLSEGVIAEPGKLVITLNDNDGGFIPKILTEINSFPSGITGVSLQDKVIFNGADAANGYELWISDGTAAGSSLLKDIYPGINSSTPSDFFKSEDDSYVLFLATTPDEGKELWRTDGTPEGTFLLKDFIPGVLHNYIYFEFTKGNKVFFVATDPVNGTEINITDGTISFFSYLHGHVFFNAKDTSNGNPLWVTDGTSENTYKVKDIFQNSACMDIGLVQEVNGTLIFAASDDSHGKELWTTDGTSVGTSLVKDLNPGSGGSVGYATFVPNHSGTKLYFNATDSNGAELWVSDGTNAGTSMVKDLYTGSTSGAPNSGSPTRITFVPGINEFLFTALKSDNKNYVFRSDGTAAGTVEVTGFGTYSATGIYKTNNSVIILVNDGGINRFYGYDKVTKSVTLLNTTYSTDKFSTGSTPYYNSRLDKFFYSTSNTTGTSHKVWATDGTVGGTVAILTIPTASYNSSNLLSVYDNGSIALFSYTLSNQPQKGEIWITDGTAGGTSKVISLPQTVNFRLVDNNGLFYFATTNTTEGNELWITDGTSPGTKILKDINPGSSNSDPNNLVNFNGQVYFTAKDPEHGIELWRTNGQSSGTELVYDINPGGESSSPSGLTPIGSTLYFKATKILSGTENWTYTP